MLGVGGTPSYVFRPSAPDARQLTFHARRTWDGTRKRSIAVSTQGDSSVVRFARRPAARHPTRHRGRQGVSAEPDPGTLAAEGEVEEAAAHAKAAVGAASPFSLCLCLRLRRRRRRRQRQRQRRVAADMASLWTARRRRVGVWGSGHPGLAAMEASPSTERRPHSASFQTRGPSVPNVGARVGFVPGTSTMRTSAAPARPTASSPRRR